MPQATITSNISFEMVKIQLEDYHHITSSNIL